MRYSHDTGVFRYQNIRQQYLSVQGVRRDFVEYVVSFISQHDDWTNELDKAPDAEFNQEQKQAWLHELASKCDELPEGVVFNSTGQGTINNITALAWKVRSSGITPLGVVGTLPISITEQPKDVDALSGETVVFKADAENYDHIQWYYNDNAIESETSNELIVVALLSNHGLYHARFTNGKHFVDTRQAELSVYLNVEHDAVLTCEKDATQENYGYLQLPPGGNGSYGAFVPNRDSEQNFISSFIAIPEHDAVSLAFELPHNVSIEDGVDVTFDSRTVHAELWPYEGVTIFTATDREMMEAIVISEGQDSNIKLEYRCRNNK
ncbi:hypothetical protein [Vibrio crassostreae]|uniref:hypothetical protein n=1 Tax=Vibrio crassostreae TaxID=246167 RepID=UPI001B3129B2|nr:hypothetical protein [Vibrio crassostreae]